MLRGNISLYFAAVSLFIFLLRCLSTKWNPEIFICHHVMTKAGGNQDFFFFFYRIYNIHFKEPLAWNAGDGQQTADWASVRWLELRAADGVSNTVKPIFNGEGHRWWKHGHYFGMSWSLLLHGQGAVGMADSGIKGSEDLGLGLIHVPSQGFRDCRALFLPITAAADLTD